MILYDACSDDTTQIQMELELSDSFSCVGFEYDHDSVILTGVMQWRLIPFQFFQRLSGLLHVWTAIHSIVRVY